MNEPLLFSKTDGIMTIRFNRPEVLNALDAATAQALLVAARDARADASTRCVVLSGEGRAFAAGGDLGVFARDLAHADDTAKTLIGPLHEALSIFARIDAPVLASVQGAVAGAGLSMALACDLAIAADDARFTLAYTAIGTSADGSSSWSLPRVVGLRKAMEIALLNDPIDATEALRLGIVNRVVPAADLISETTKLAQKLASGATGAYGEMKRLLRASLENDLETQMQREADAFERCARTPDFAEGITAFFGRRRPTFGGQATKVK